MILLPGVLAADEEVRQVCQQQDWRFCFIGGVAVQRWGDPRLTQDVDLTLLAGFASEEAYIDACLSRLSPRREVWEAATGRKLLNLPHRNVVWCVAFSPDGRRIVTGGWDHTAKVWDAATGEELLVLKGHTGNVRSVTFSPDAQRIVTGSEDRSVKIWDAASGQEVFSLKVLPTRCGAWRSAPTVNDWP